MFLTETELSTSCLLEAGLCCTTEQSTYGTCKFSVLLLPYGTCKFLCYCYHLLLMLKDDVLLYCDCTCEVVLIYTSLSLDCAVAAFGMRTGGKQKLKVN